MANGSLLKEILDSLEDPDVIQLFAAANGLVGDIEVENRLRELKWDKHIDNLWQEFCLIWNPLAKKFDIRLMTISLQQVDKLGVGGVPRTHSKNPITFGRETLEH